MGINNLSRDDDKNHRRLIRQLREAGRPKDLRQANVLARCTEERPCRSAACIHCGRDFQSLALDTVERDIRNPARRELRGRVSAFTIVPTTGCLAPGKLTAAACRRVVADVTTAFDDCGISTFAVSLDISFNEDETGKLEPHWCAHTHGDVLDYLTTEQDEALRKHFPRSRLVAVPVVVTPLDSKDTGPLYSFKPDRGRRVAYLNKRNPDRRPHRDTRRRDLRPWQAVELAHVEHELGFDARLTTGGIDEEALRTAFDAFYHARDGP